MFSPIRGLTRARLGPWRMAGAVPRHALNFRAMRYHNRVSPGLQPNHALYPPEVLPILKELWVLVSQKLISWEKFSVALAVLGGAGLGVFFYTHQQDVLFTKRKQFNFTSTETAARWMMKNDAETFMTYLSLGTLNRFVPDTQLPEDHPSYIAVFRIFKRILEAGHYNPEDRLWVLGIIALNAPIPAGDRLQFAGITGLVVIDSEVLLWLGSEGALAGLFGKILAPLVLRHHEEALSHRRFLFCAPIPAVPLIITSVVKRRLLVLALPYVATYVAAWCYFRKIRSKFDDERGYVALRLTRQLGYDLNEYIKYFKDLLNRNEQRLREQKHRLAGDYGPNLPVEVEEDFRDGLKIVEEQREKLRKIEEWVPQIMAETANDAIMQQDLRKIPLPTLEHEGDPPQ